MADPENNISKRNTKSKEDNSHNTSSKDGRHRISKQLQSKIDRQTVRRLKACGKEPNKSSRRYFIDVETEPGRVFSPTNLRSRWIFCAEGKKRAARISAEFDLFKANHDLSQARHVVLRDKPHKNGIQNKFGYGGLEEGLKSFAKVYDRRIGKLVAKKLIRPLLVSVHPRWDIEIGAWDIHAHCIWNIESKHLDRVHEIIDTKFSTSWEEAGEISNAGALSNYIAGGVIDYEQLKDWPDDALVELWDLGSARLIRPAGQFAKFHRTLAPLRLVRSEGSKDSITTTPRLKKTGSMGDKFPENKIEKKQVLGIARVLFDGRRRLCLMQTHNPGRSEDLEIIWPSEQKSGPPPDIELGFPAKSGAPYTSFSRLSALPIVRSRSATPKTPPDIENSEIVRRSPEIYAGLPPDIETEESPPLYSTTSTRLTPPSHLSLFTSSRFDDKLIKSIPIRKRWMTKAWQFSTNNSYGPIHRRMTGR